MNAIRLGNRFNNAAARDYNHINGSQFWYRQTIKDDYWEHYTPLFIDLVDDFNQRQIFGWGSIQPNDYVSGYPFSVLEHNVLRHTDCFSSLKERLKLFKPTGVTDAQIDELINFYSNL